MQALPATPAIKAFVVFDEAQQIQRPMTIRDALEIITNKVQQKENVPLTLKNKIMVLYFKTLPTMVGSAISYGVGNQLNRRDSLSIRALTYNSMTCRVYHDSSYTITSGITISQILMLFLAYTLFLTTIFLIFNKRCSRILETPFRPSFSEHRKFKSEIVAKYKENLNDVLTDENDLKKFAALMQIEIQKPEKEPAKQE